MMSTHPQNTERDPFNIVVQAFALFILIVGFVIPSQAHISKYLRWLLFLPYTWYLLWNILYATTGDPQGDVGAGGALGTLLLVGFDFLILTDAQKELYPVDNKNKRVGVCISERSLQARIKWALQLIGNPRGIGWNFEPAFLVDERKRRRRPDISRGPVILQQFIKLVLFIGLDQLGTRLGFLLFTPSNPMRSSTMTGVYSNVAQALWKGAGIAAFAATSYARISALHCAVSIIAVGIFNSDSCIHDWQPMFGSIKDAWSVQRFWGRFWHQSIRRSLTSCAESVVMIYPYQDHTSLVSCLRICAAFFITGIVHGAGEYMMLASIPREFVYFPTRGYPGQGACTFFVLQSGAILVEKAAAHLICPRNDRVTDVHGKRQFKSLATTGSDIDASSSGGYKGYSPRHKHEKGDISASLMRVLGYIWVAGWLVWSVQYLIDPMIGAGVFNATKRLETWSIELGV